MLGAPSFDSVDDLVSGLGSLQPLFHLHNNEHWAMIRSLVAGVRAAGGTWAAYARSAASVQFPPAAQIY